LFFSYEYDIFFPCSFFKNVTQEKDIKISKILDIEEHFWSPMFGIKGLIDATVEIQTTPKDDTKKTLIAPLELKTGKASNGVAHRAQTILYTLMLMDRYGKFYVIFVSFVYV